MTARYDYKCPECGIIETVTRFDLETWGVPTCVGRYGFEHHEEAKVRPHPLTTMKRKYSEVTVVWPKEKRGH